MSPLRIIGRLASRILKRLFSPEFLKFNLVGATGVAVNMISYMVLSGWFGIHYMLSGALSTEIAIINNFVLNDVWTFRGRNTRRTIWMRALLFHASRVLGMAVTLGVLFILVDLLGMDYVLAYLIAIGVGVLVNFYTSDIYVWTSK